MRLGLIYREIGHGTGEAFPVINNGGWNVASNFISEFGRTLSEIGVSTNDTKSIAIGFKYIQSGQLICLVRRMEVRGDSSRSNQALWIYVPSQVILSEHEMKQLLSSTEAMFGNSMAFTNPTRFMEAVPEIFKRDFPASPYPFATGNMTGDKVAVISAPEEGEIEKILDMGYQKAYSGYGLILVSKGGAVSSVLPRIDAASLKRTIWVTWPIALPSNLQGPTKLAIGIDRMSLNPKGMSVTVGPHNILLQRPDFEPIEEVINIKAENAGKPLDLGHEWQGKQWLKKLSLRSWSVANERGGSLTRDCEFHSPDTVDARGNLKPMFKTSDTVYVPEKKLNNFRVEVSAPGYESESKTLDLATPQQVTFLLKRSASASGYVESRRQGGGSDSAGRSGGSVSNIDRNELFALRRQLEAERKEKGIWRLIALIISAAAIVFLILWLTKGGDETSPADADNPVDNIENVQNVDGIEDENGDKKSEEDQTKQSDQREEESQQSNENTQPRMQSAIEYLDNNRNWTVEEMADIPELQGLYADLENYNWDQLAEFWPERLPGSSKLKKIAAEAKMNLNKQVNPHASGSDLKGVDTNAQIIHVDQYIRDISNMRLEKRESKKSESPTNELRKPQNPQTKVNGKGKGTNTTRNSNNQNSGTGINPSRNKTDLN